MNTSARILTSMFLTALTVTSLPAFADMDKKCNLHHEYGYQYNGTSYTPDGPVPFTEAGWFNVAAGGDLNGEGILTFFFSDFSGFGPLWLLLREVQSSGVVTIDANDKCSGTIDFLASGTVIKTSNASLVPEGTPLFTDSPRSIAYTISGLKNEIVDIISTSPGTIATGIAHRKAK